jgi:succinate dehydrogenase / fumarate reductase iron-sulfur subunit
MKVICRVLRQNPGGPPHWAQYHAEVEEGATVLDLLRSISGQDPGLAYTAHHCKLGICAGCRMVINGRKRLACRTLVQSPQIRLEPVPGLPVIKDLLADLLAPPPHPIPLPPKGGRGRG